MAVFINLSSLHCVAELKALNEPPWCMIEVREMNRINYNILLKKVNQLF